MNTRNCIRPDGDCSIYSSYDEDSEECFQDEDLGGTGRQLHHRNEELE